MNYPILEFDSSPKAVLQPDHGNLDIKLPPCAAFPFVGDMVDEYAAKRGYPVIAVFDTVTKKYPVYKVSNQVCLCQAPVGASVAVSFMDWMIAYGVRRVVSAGSCGTLIDLPENTFVIPKRALRDEGTSYHYMPPSRWITLDSGMQRRIANTFDDAYIPYVFTDTWTTDAIFRETIDKVRRSRAEGCGVVDMECSALAACADFRCIEFGHFLYTADSLADPEAYNERHWGEASLMPALVMCLKVLGVSD